jgi:hypothetical protein
VRVHGGATGVKDVAGNALASDATWSFTSAADTSAPTISSVAPADGATGVARSVNVRATFNEAMDASTITTGTFELRAPGGALVAASVTYDSTARRAILDPLSNLAAGTTYTATVRGGTTDPRVKDQAGNALATNRVWTFTTR